MEVGRVEMALAMEVGLMVERSLAMEVGRVEMTLAMGVGALVCGSGSGGGRQV